MGNNQLRIHDYLIPITTDNDGLSFDKWINAYSFYNESVYGYPIYFVDSYDYGYFTQKQYDY